MTRQPGSRVNRRIPYMVRVRCILNGADTSKVLYLKDRNDALETMRRYVPRHEREAIRLLDCREATADEMKAVFRV